MIDATLGITLLHDTNYTMDQRIGQGSSGTIVRGHTRALPSAKNLASRSLPTDLEDAREMHPPHNANFASLSPLRPKQLDVTKFRVPSSEQKVIKIFHPKRSHYYHREKRVLEKLKGCDNIVVMHKAVSHLNRYYIVMEECATDLADIVSKVGFLSEDEARSYFRQMANGLISAHGNSICHHDVKLENFFVTDDGQVKLGDFGYSVCMDDDPEITQTSTHDQTYISGKYSAGSPAYASPQILFHLPHLPQQTDIYSLGVCLFVMLCGRFPFCNPAGNSRTELKRNAVSFRCDDQDGGFVFPEHLSAEAVELLTGMLAVRESDRWDWEEILTHSWCADFA